MAERVTAASGRTAAAAAAIAEEARLAVAFQRGEPGADAAVWRLYAPMVHQFFARALGRDPDLEDLLQEVFLRLFRVHGALREPAALRSFVYSIAVRVLKWQLRRRRVRRIVGLSRDGALPDAALEGGPEAAEALRQFYRLLDGLEASARAAFVLHHLEGLSLVETAAALGTSLATAKRRIRAATLRLEGEVAGDEVLSAYFSGERALTRGQGA